MKTMKKKEINIVMRKGRNVSFSQDCEQRCFDDSVPVKCCLEKVVIVKCLSCEYSKNPHQFIPRTLVFDPTLTRKEVLILIEKRNGRKQK